MKIRLSATALIATSLIACSPEPDLVSLTSRADETYADEPLPTQLVEGDLLVVDAVGLDSGDPMEACAAAASSDPAVLEALPVRGDCRVFLLLARRPGHARVTFTVRGVSAASDIEVVPTP